MAHNSVQEHVEELEARLRQLESQKVRTGVSFWEKCKDALALHEEQAANRIIGWGILALTALALINNIQNQSILFLLVITGSVGIWLIVQASGLVDESDSVRQLATESRAERAVHSHVAHKTALAYQESKPKNLFSWMALVIGVFIGVVALTYAYTNVTNDHYGEVLLVMVIFAVVMFEVTRRELSKFLRYLLIGGSAILILLLPASPAVLALVLFLTGIALWYAIEKRDTPLRIGILAAALYITQIWFVPQSVQSNIVSELVRQLAGFILVAVALFPYVQKRRVLDDRDSARLSITIGASGLLLTLISSALSFLDYGWALALLSTGLVLAGLGYFSWIANERLSYSKYFLTLALGAGAGFALLAFDATTITLTLFVAGIVVSALGFTLPSYSARLVGVGLLGLTVLSYLLLLMPATTQYSGLFLLRERVWVGILLALFLPILAHWYELAKLRGMEQLLVPTLILSSYVTSFLILFGIIYLDIAAPLQTVLWLILAAITYIASQQLKRLLLRFLAIGLGAAAFVKLILSDSASMTPSERIVLFICVAGVLIFLGTSSAFQKKQSRA